ncbi:MAG: DUF2505 domain-containing protein [Stenotrophobium sp.]
MKQTIEARFPASSDLVIKMMTDKKFYCDRLEKQGHKVYEVLSHHFDGKNFSVKFKRKVPAVTVVHEDSWNVATKTGRISVELQGMPVEMTGETSLRDEGKDCVLTYTWNIHSKVPLVGGKIEKSVAAANEKEIPEQTRFGIELLKNYR